jgi:peptide/nickel transport system permease protein
MRRLLVRRILVSIVLLLVVSALSFVLVSLTPGDPARQILGMQADPGQYVALRHTLGLDEPVYQQYFHWIRHAVRGDLGRSIFSSEDVRRAIDSRLPVTLSLMLGALFVSVVAGLGLGTISALRGGLAGRLVDALALLGFSIPAFWLAAELIALFAVRFTLFPPTGYVPFTQSPTGWARALTLPVLALAVGGMAAIAKQTRESLLDVLGSEYIRMAWANGLAWRSIVFRHAFKNMAPPVLAVVGVQAVSLLGGTVLVENVFALPGLGSLAVQATIQHDIPVVEGLAVYFTVIVVMISVSVDLAYGLLNPRLRIQ